MEIHALGGLLLFEKIQECLPVTVDGPGGCRGRSASLFFDKHLGFKLGADIVGAFIGHPDLNRPDAFIACSRIEIQAITAGMQICPAILAFVCYLHLLDDLYFSSAIVAARDLLKSGLHPAGSRFGVRPSRRRLGAFFTLLLLIA
jgi:hypothetical protein